MPSKVERILMRAGLIRVGRSGRGDVRRCSGDDVRAASASTLPLDPREHDLRRGGCEALKLAGSVVEREEREARFSPPPSAAPVQRRRPDSKWQSLNKKTGLFLGAAAGLSKPGSGEASRVVMLTGVEAGHSTEAASCLGGACRSTPAGFLQGPSCGVAESGVAACLRGGALFTALKTVFANGSFGSPFSPSVYEDLSCAAFLAR